ncbi:MAG: 1,4-alpha-glucan branching enzyme, partial [Oscillospiraceae bacterium]|nr:1,4-alpha-glucan branching enzyme [Oscillospiraceae bacterium]
MITITDVKSANNLPIYLFHQGTNFRSYELMGCQFDSRTGDAVFRTWAPGAKAICLTGDFNDWREDDILMKRISEGGIWEVAMNGLVPGQRYKYAITSENGKKILKADPYAFYSETETKTASIVCDLSGYEWGDDEWRRETGRKTIYDRPVNIYEVHPASWMKEENGDTLGYTQIAERLLKYVTEMN